MEPTDCNMLSLPNQGICFPSHKLHIIKLAQVEHFQIISFYKLCQNKTSQLGFIKTSPQNMVSNSTQLKGPIGDSSEWDQKRGSGKWKEVETKASEFHWNVDRKENYNRKKKKFSCYST